MLKGVETGDSRIVLFVIYHLINVLYMPYEYI